MSYSTAASTSSSPRLGSPRQPADGVIHPTMSSSDRGSWNAHMATNTLPVSDLEGSVSRGSPILSGSGSVTTGPTSTGVPLVIPPRESTSEGPTVTSLRSALPRVLPTPAKPWDKCSRSTFFTPPPRPVRTLAHGIPLQAAHSILERFLSLENPQISPKLIDYLLLNGVIELFVDFIALSPFPRCQPTLTPVTRGYDFPDLLSRFLPPLQRTLPGLEVTKRSYTATQSLTLHHNTHSDKLLSEKLEIILCSLFEIFEPGSQGNFNHFRVLTKYCLDNLAERTLQCLLTVNPHAPTCHDAYLRMLLANKDRPQKIQLSVSSATSSADEWSDEALDESHSLNSDHSIHHANVSLSNGYSRSTSSPPSPLSMTTHLLYQGHPCSSDNDDTFIEFARQFLTRPKKLPLIFGVLPYLAYPPVLDFVVHVIVRRSTFDVYHERFEHLREEGLVDFLFLMLDSRWDPLVYQGATDLICALVNNHYNIVFMELLFKGWEAHQHTPRCFTRRLVQNIMDNRQDQLTRCSVEILAGLMKKTACLYGRWIRQCQQSLKVEPAFGPQNNLVGLGQWVRRSLEKYLPQLCQILVQRCEVYLAPGEAASLDARSVSRSPGSGRSILDYTHLQLIEVIYHVLVESEILDTILVAIPYTFWFRVFDMYFHHRSNSLLHSCVYKFFTLLVHNVTCPVFSEGDELSNASTTACTSDGESEPREAGQPPRTPSIPIPKSRLRSHRRRSHRGAGGGGGNHGTSHVLAGKRGSASTGMSGGGGSLPNPTLSRSTASPTFTNLAHYSLGACPSKPTPESSCPSTPTAPYSKALSPFGFCNDILLALVKRYGLVQRLIRACQDRRPSNSLRGTSLLLLNTIRLGIETVELELELEQGKIDLLEPVTMASSYESDPHLTPHATSPRLTPPSGGIFNTPGDWVSVALTGHPQESGVSSGTGDSLGRSPINSRTAGVMSPGLSEWTGPWTMPYALHWASYVQEQPLWHDYLPELRAITQRQIEPWTTFQLVNFERKPFACQPPLPYFSPLNIRMPEEYANNYLNRRTPVNTQEGLFGTRVDVLSASEPIRGVVLDESSIDLGSLYAFCLGFGISAGRTPTKEGGVSSGTPQMSNSRSVRKRGLGKRRKRIKSTGGVVSRSGKSNGVSSTGQSVSETSPATIVEEDEEVDGNTPAGNVQKLLPSSTEVTLPRPFSPKLDPVSDFVASPDSLASDTLVEIQREQRIKEEFYRKAGIPDQSKIPLYLPVLVRPRTADDPKYDSDSSGEEDQAEEDDDVSASQMANPSEPVPKEERKDSEDPWRSNDANGSSTSTNSSRTTAREDSKMKDSSGVLNSNEPLSSASQSCATENRPSSGVDDDDGEYVIVPAQLTTPNTPQQPNGGTVASKEERSTKRQP
ncbi:hypothetical protein IWQ61_001315 [Dispira simplex]|nr:hypothetical protein IWQ61_001315 [Dispira simplex]